MYICKEWPKSLTCPELLSKLLGQIAQPSLSRIKGCHVPSVLRWIRLG